MSGGTTRVGVTVTFLKLDGPAPVATAVAWPEGVALRHVPRPSVAFYRYLYDTVGAPYVWWLRRTLPDEQLAGLLAAPGVEIYVLYRDHEPAGFFELDSRAGVTVNISYFGLLPHAVGLGLGGKLLRAALELAWIHRPRAITVNTCTADHPRAMPTYLNAGFKVQRSAPEVWDIPNRLGLKIPDHLRL